MYVYVHIYLTIFIDMFLKHPNLKDLRILRIYSKSIEIKYYYGPHSNKVSPCHINNIHTMCMQALSKPESEQECRDTHKPYALHKKIRNDDCPLSKEILEMERKFERLFIQLHLCTYLVIFFVGIQSKRRFHLHMKDFISMK